jgi:hypothetical protein
MVALLEALELDVDIGDDRIKHVDEQGAPDAGRWYGSLVPVGQAVAFTPDTLDGPHLLPARSDRRGKEQR